MVQRTVAFLLLLALISGIGYSYPLQRMLCDYWCDETDVPVKFVRDLLNGISDEELQEWKEELERTKQLDDYYPIEEPQPQNYHNYYALLMLERRLRIQSAIPLTRYECLHFLT